MREKGWYYTNDGYDVMLALGEGIRPRLTGVDHQVLGMLARTTKGWTVTGGSLGLRWVAEILHVNGRTLDRSLQRLEDEGCIRRTRSRTHATYRLDAKFVVECNRWVARSKAARGLHEVCFETKLSLDAVYEAHLLTGLSGWSLIRALQDPEYPDGYEKRQM